MSGDAAAQVLTMHAEIHMRAILSTERPLRRTQGVQQVQDGPVDMPT